jgi:hypothetical protein
MRWIYILECENNYFYVGETKRLYRRFWEHLEGIGGLNTAIFKPIGIVAIYKVSTISKFIDYNLYVTHILNGVWHDEYKPYKLMDFTDINDEDEETYLDCENNITECLMIHCKDNWKKIRGGKYTRFTIEYGFPDNEYIQNLPLCKCGLPCDIKKNEEKNYLYFRCAKKNMWNKLREEFDIYDDPCNFFMEYTKDKQLKENENKNFETKKQNLNELFKTSYCWLKNIPKSDNNEPECCIGGCDKGFYYKKIIYSNKELDLCYDCFINKNKELANQYTITKPKLEGVCLLKYNRKGS